MRAGAGAPALYFPATDQALFSDMGSVVEILIACSPSSSMESLQSVSAIPGKGLEGDRYFTGVGTFSPQPQKPDFEITFIEAEKIEAFAKEAGVPFTASHARRNIVTRGIDLNSLVGCRFSVGNVQIQGIRLCEPCNYLAKTTFSQTLSGLVHKAGLRAQILSPGTIQVGDLLTLSA